MQRGWHVCFGTWQTAMSQVSRAGDAYHASSGDLELGADVAVTLATSPLHRAADHGAAADRAGRAARSHSGASAGSAKSAALAAPSRRFALAKGVVGASTDASFSSATVGLYMNGDAAHSTFAGSSGSLLRVAEDAVNEACVRCDVALATRAAVRRGSHE